ncbi:hypothetical protein PMZ80_010530 [Knufia obscura]|uniref:Uncharacterized protein n=2 Tax=Knufia TaxID=430999 RepID=A0AAN8I1W5_9EURO|nr:hypothetical protein PMZ80_010530 [Knufia obscura]KAK5950117.1 hypothetical protein OHC33_008832 [Knufia fluminis]
MLPPHGSRYGYPGTIVSLFTQTDDGDEINDNIDSRVLKSSGGPRAPNARHEEALRNESHPSIPPLDHGSHQDVASRAPLRGTNSRDTGPQPREASLPIVLSAASETIENAGTDTVATAKDHLDQSDDKQCRTGSKRLTRDQRRDILLMRRLGHKYEDIAKFLGVTQAGVQYTINTGRASPEHHKAGRKKQTRPDVPRHANGRKIRSDVGRSKRSALKGKHNEQLNHSSEDPMMTHAVAGITCQDSSMQTAAVQAIPD